MKKIGTSILALAILSGCQFSEENSNTEVREREQQDTVALTETKENNPPIEEEQKPTPNEAERMLTVSSDKLNKTVEVDGRQVVQNPNNPWVMVNKKVSLAENYAPQDLVRPNVPFVFGDEQVEKALLRKEAAVALEKWFAKAKEENVAILAASGYRSYERQAVIFDATASAQGEEHAAVAVALPGSSEHQTGLAMDITSPSVEYDLVQEYGETPEGKWLADTAPDFGFILRYPSDKVAITGYMYEPWHFRYVGEELAQYLKERNWTLEEYMNEVKAI